MNLTGKTFGRWTVKGVGKRRGRRQYWSCQCVCGECREVLEQNLTNGRSQSCGCLSREMAAERLRNRPDAHHLSRTRLYKIWIKLRDRCTNKSNPRYRFYGGRGIKVVREWNDFFLFQKWAVESGYSDELSIDRIDNDQGYSPSNCRWVSQKEQVRNRRCTAQETINGTTKSVAEWCEILGLPYYIGQSRHQRHIPLNKPYKPQKSRNLRSQHG